MDDSSGRRCEGRKALADLFSEESEGVIEEGDGCESAFAESGRMDQALQKLRDLSRPIAIRYIAWRLVEAFAHDKVGDLVYWALLCARFQEWEGDADTLIEMRKMLSLQRAIAN
jgi:hypothetical protein